MINLFAKSCTDSPLFIIAILLLVFGSIVAGVILVKKYVKPFQNDDKPKDAIETAKEEVNRLLVDVEDEKTAKAIASYKRVDKSDEKEGEDKPILK